jgi:hypothetical protein
MVHYPHRADAPAGSPCCAGCGAVQGPAWQAPSGALPAISPDH